MDRVCLKDYPLGSIFFYVGPNSNYSGDAQKVYYKTLPDNQLEVVPYIWTVEEFSQHYGHSIFTYYGWDIRSWKLISSPETLKPEDFL